jgi:hypothetical protein
MKMIFKQSAFIILFVLALSTPFASTDSTTDGAAPVAEANLDQEGKTPNTK